jgi:hypothetical protein
MEQRIRFLGAVYKRGEKLDCTNYRGICVTFNSCLQSLRHRIIRGWSDQRLPGTWAPDWTNRVQDRELWKKILTTNCLEAKQIF